VVAVAVWVTAGCSGRPKVDKGRVDAVAQEKVDIMKRMADELDKDPSGRNIPGLVEEFMMTPLDPKEYPAQAEEIVKIYNARVKDRVKGDAATQLQGAIKTLQSAGAKSP
jgi:hypothetical protein